MRALSFVLTLLFSATVAADCLTPQWQEAWQNVSAYDLREHALADFNGDGQADIAAIARTAPNQPATKVVLITNPYFANNSERLVYTGTNLRGVAALDMTGDGKADIVLADSSEKKLLVLPGKGNGTFGSPVVTNILDAPAEFVVADFRRDGHPDLAAITSSPALVTMYAGTGTGAFVATTQETIPASPISISAGDLDNDGSDDLMIGHFDSANVSVLFGNGDGSLGDGASIPTRKWVAGAVAVDLDGDGDRELVASNYDNNTISVNINNGHRTFRAVVTYDGGFGERAAIANPYSFVTGDFTGDGRPDVVLGTLNGNNIVEYSAKSDGTLRSGYAASCADCRLLTLASTDYNHDGRLDVIAVTGFAVSVFLNQCGTSTMQFSTTTPTISAGQPVTFTVGVDGPFSTGNTIPPNGTIAIRDGAATIKSIPAALHTDVVVDGLSVGDHTLTARYGGDDEYEPNTSSSVVVHVVAQTTSIALTQSQDQTTLGTDFTISLQASSDGNPVATGTVRLLIDGAVQRTANAPGFADTFSLPAGQHAIVGEYLGDASHAPSTASLVHTVSRGTVTMKVVAAGNLFNVTIDGVSPWQPSGTVRLMEGPTTVATATLDSGKAAVAASALAPGEHSLRVSYEGDANYLPADSAPFVYTVAQPTRRRSARH